MWKKSYIWYFEFFLLGVAIEQLVDRKIIKCNEVLFSILVISIFSLLMYQLIRLLRSAIEEGRKKKK